MNTLNNHAITIPVSEGAVIQRINRKLRPKWQGLRVARNRYQNQLGRYYVVDFYLHSVVETHVDLECMARELGVLLPHETIA